MCGIIGAFGDIGFDVQHAVEDLLQMDVVRGPHSTGMCLVPNKDRAPVVIKDVGGPDVVLKHPSYDATTRFENILMLGHNRFATKGTVNRKNSHPFRRKHITLVHNGTLLNQTHLETNRKFETDSEAITYAIATEGIDFAWKNLDGAAALVWWDREAKTLNFLRNSQRPLHFMYTEKRACIIWASEAWMLRGVLTRRGVRTEDDQIWYPTPDKLFSYSMEEGKVVSTARALEKFSWTGRYKAPLPVPTYYRRQDGNKTIWQRAMDQWDSYKGDADPNVGWDDGTLSWIESGSSHEPPKHRKGKRPLKDRTKATVISLPPNQRVADVGYDPDRENLAPRVMDYIEFIGKYKHCIFCEDHFITEDDYRKAVILDDEQAACGSCVDVAHLSNTSVTGALQ